MKNLNEPRKRDDVIPFERPGTLEKTESPEPTRPYSQLSDDLRSRWTAVQSSFVDEPRKAVEEADKLIAGAIQQIQDSFAAARSDLARRWNREGETSTEELRVCLQHYRNFFDRLVSKL
jgi:hypothetical protein